MIRFVLILLITCLLFACNQSATDTKKMQATIDSLQQQLNNSYKPGFGEFMSGIQVHHAKLWFAGINANWPLAGFEVHEIKESLDDINTYCTDRPEVKELPMINTPLDSLAKSIERKNVAEFKMTFTALTNTCNNCHRATEHGFNVVTIPSSLPVVNQDFKTSSQ